MKSDLVSPSAGLYSYVKSITEEVRALAVKNQIACISASQLNRAAVNKTEGIDNSAISDSYSTAATSDWLCFILQNEEMKANSEVLVKITKNRYTGITDSFVMNIDYPKMRFCEIIENQEVPDNALVPFTSVEQKVNAESFAKQAIIEDSKANQEIAKKFNSQTISDDELNALLGI